MCSISDIPIVNHISEGIVGAVSRGVRYILFYKDNVEKLKSEIKGLDNMEQEIERQVEQAKNNGKIIKEHVSKWLVDVKKIKDEVTEFLENYEGRPSCLANPYRRFQLGRRAAKKTTTVSEFSDLEKKQITGEISYFPPKEYSPISSTEYQNFGSREVAYEKILKALNNKEDSFPVVGVYGFGGVGKTTMMEEASKEVKAKGIFKTVARANVGQVVDIGKIQDQLATYLSITEKSEDRTSQLKARLSKGDTILVILDDVWSKIPFTEIGIPFGDSSIKGCKILLTSRLLDVCKYNNCKDPVEIEALTEDEAWGMFTKAVGISTSRSEGDSFARQVCNKCIDDSLAKQVCNKCIEYSLAKKVCNKCRGLPLIIAAVGKVLHEKSQVFWKDALHQLNNCKPEKIHGIDPDVYACLRLSFNVLDKDAYLCLLLCSLAGEDEEIRIEFLFRLATGSGLLEDWNTLEDARNRVNVMVSVLKSSSLLLDGRDYDGVILHDSVKLHDIIRDVARSITHDKESEYKFLSGSNWPKVGILSSPKLIYLNFKNDNVSFPDDLVCPDLHTLYLTCSNLSGVQPPDSFFKSFRKLKYLFLNINSLSAMPSSIQNLDSLRSLTIRRCKVNDISHIIQLKKLEMLSLQKSCFGGLLLDLRQLRHLRMLYLRGCTKIMGIVLSGLVYLEELCLPVYCNILDEETPLSSVTSKLTSLEIYFENVKSCPDENFCKNLCRYKIYVGGDPYDDGFWGDAIKSVYLCNDSIGGGVKTLVERGEEVFLERVTGLQECFSQGGGGAFADLKRLKIKECMGDECLSRIHQPSVGGSFSQLSVLKIYDSGFKYLFCTSTARCLQQLEEICIINCEMMEEIVRNEGQINQIIDFPKLRCLELVSLPVFKSFCGKVGFPALEELHIYELDNITKIWEQPLVVLPKLKELDLRGLPKLMETGLNSSHIILYPNLATLSIDGCNSLRNVFVPLVANHYLKLLEELTIASCEMMNEIIDSIGKDGEEILRVNNIEFPMLKALQLEQLPKMNSFWGYGIVEPNLDQQNSSQACKVSFPSLEILFSHGVKINSKFILKLGRDDLDDSPSKLRRVSVRGESQAPQLIPPNWLLLCRDLEYLGVFNCYFHERDLFSLPGNSSWKNNPYGTTISFRRLMQVEVDSCRLLTIFTCSVAKGLQELETLKVTSCGSIEEIVTDTCDTCEEISFPKLKLLVLEDLPNLKSFCLSANYCFKMPSLVYVYISSCPQMPSFPPRQISTPKYTTDINSYLH